MPVESATVDVVVSNRLLNLVTGKLKAFREIRRVLKPGGHFTVSDVVLKGELPDMLKNDATMYAGCVAGALQMDDYLKVIRQAGFIDIEIHKEKEIDLPDELLQHYLSTDELAEFRIGATGIFSFTLSGTKQESM